MRGSQTRGKIGHPKHSAQALGDIRRRHCLGHDSEDAAGQDASLALTIEALQCLADVTDQLLHKHGAVFAF